MPPQMPRLAPVLKNGTPNIDNDRVSAGDVLSGMQKRHEIIYNKIGQEISTAKGFRDMINILNTWKSRENDLDVNLRSSLDMISKINNAIYVIVKIIAPLAKQRDVAGLDNLLKHLVSSDDPVFETTDKKKFNLTNDEASFGILEKIRVILSHMIASDNLSSVDINLGVSAIEEEFKDIDGLA